MLPERVAGRPPTAPTAPTAPTPQTAQTAQTAQTDPTGAAAAASRRLRRATADDVEAVARLRAVMFAAMGVPGADDRAWRHAAEGWLRNALAGREVCVVVAEDRSGAVVSSAMGTVRRECPSPRSPNGVSGVVSGVSTLPEARGRGHATACVAAVVEWFRAETKACSVELFATREGERMYASLGFRATVWPAMRMKVSR